MKLDILTIFPEIISAYMQESIMKRALEKQQVALRIFDIREYSSDLKHFKVDDIPYGGATGMVMQVEPIKKCLESIGAEKSFKIITSPKGKKLNMSYLRSLQKQEHIVIICGHYEGIDERVKAYIDEEVSIGDYVLTGGELPALVIADSLIRLIPEVVGNSESVSNDSFFKGLLDWDVYTRPRVFDETGVPEVLFSGDHKKIEQWKKSSAIINTLIHRPDLFSGYVFNKEEKEIIKDYLHKED